MLDTLNICDSFFFKGLVSDSSANPTTDLLSLSIKPRTTGNVP